MNATRPKSLDGLIKDMVGRLEIIKSDTAYEVRRVDVLIAIDPVLAALYKEYCDVKVRHDKLLETNGPDDAMVEVSADVVDSAKSALDTRILELEEQAEGEGTEALVLRRRIRREQARAELKLARECQKLKEEREADNDAFFWMMLWTWLTKQTLYAAQRHLSARSAFASANLMLGSAWKGAQAAA